ncbi:MAG: cob(I)yrinic acid a,c-diamide adenosyltransferase [Fimbriimonas ginsengisoli]|uniref:Corrinoid adenosyltransferase n=1 Tax=Fimbriimonas ginsengisoli TaxID=1005039 RepID=A0A931LXE5_FIMGI|nr:cob(I)yrinic acid a,c-diamide adenosyltransferase [Fimbriimonas ginsengisoli]MBI3721174.1 cob(I)yrinic acid a,c-diamide adenosyltransferase [Fimbriimonas ginsengisoli]
MKIYTRKGDAGRTSLFGGAVTLKTDPRIVAIGEVDELNAAMGLVRTHAGETLAAQIEEVQCQLFELGAQLASPELAGLAEGSGKARTLESWIDAAEQGLPQLKNFILPGGTALAADLHVARAVCRRAERAVFALHDRNPQRADVLAFLNRLSDWLFVVARVANAEAGVPDTIWKGSHRK